MVIGWSLALRIAEERWLLRVETNAQWESVERVMAVDIHQALSIHPLKTSLDITTISQLQYHYGVNAHGQLVRTQVGGGTAVLCTGLKDVNFALDSATITIGGEFVNGSKREAAYTALAIATTP
ncbi:hypothetical protein D2Q93_00820 [Alicyclobacillaceae bacterium I2511]|nr:hypothetical protein D2Q93_00820 [Alicyclobacillaceae bacterium I2511]